ADRAWLRGRGRIKTSPRTRRGRWAARVPAAHVVHHAGVLRVHRGSAALGDRATDGSRPQTASGAPGTSPRGHLVTSADDRGQATLGIWSFAHLLIWSSGHLAILFGHFFCLARSSARVPACIP